MYVCESRTIKAEHWRTDAFELWCWRRLSRVPWTAGRSNQSILKEINPEYPLEGLMLKLKLQYFGHLMWRTDSLGKTLMLGNIEGRGRRGWQKMRCCMASLTGWTWVWASSGSCWCTGRPACCSPWGRRVGHNWATKLNWTDTGFLIQQASWTCLVKVPAGSQLPELGFWEKQNSAWNTLG